MDDGKLSTALNESVVPAQKKSFTVPRETLKFQATTLSSLIANWQAMPRYIPRPLVEEIPQPPGEKSRCDFFLSSPVAICFFGLRLVKDFVRVRKFSYYNSCVELRFFVRSAVLSASVFPMSRMRSQLPFATASSRLWSRRA